MFNILRCEKIKSRQEITKISSHNFRLRSQANIDGSKTGLNRVVFNSLNVDTSNASDLGDKVFEHYEKLGVKVKTDNVLMLEFVVSASPEFFKDISKSDLERWVNSQIEFMKSEFGDNLKLGVLHLDEKTPHFHFVVSTELESTKKYKNQFGSFEKKTWSLNAKRFDPEFLIGLHDRHAKINLGFKLDRGVRNSVRVHKPLKHFYKMVDRALSVDYAREIKKALNSVGNVLGLVKISEVEEKITPMLNNVLKQNKALREKFKFDIVQFSKSLSEKEMRLNELEKRLIRDRDIYIKSVEKAMEYKRTIEKQKIEIDRLIKLLTTIEKPIENDRSILPPASKSMKLKMG